MVKLIAIPKKPLSLITTPYNPAANPASLTVSSYWCDQNCAPVAKGPDLAVGAAPVVTPTVVAAGLPVNVDAWSVANGGTVSAGPRRYGYYLSKTTALDLLPTGLVDTSKDVFLGSVEGTIVPLLPGTSETLAPTAVTIPLTTAPGTWYLLLYADDLRTVNELSENNNILLAASITITADTTPPVIDAHAAVTAEATGPNGATVTYINPTALDGVDGPVAVSCAPVSGTLFHLGSTTVTCQASDKAGNQATSTFAVTVVDTTAPVVASHPDVITEAIGPAGATAAYTNPVATDAVDGTDPVSCLPASGSLFPVGTTTVTCNARDAAGNTSAPGTFAVKIVDTTGPVIINTPAAILKEAIGPGGAPASWAAPTATDTVDGTVAVTCLPASGSTFPLGSTNVTCTAKDAHGNAAVPTSFVVRVTDTRHQC